ncbi:unnamed protein product, partial [Medioppia subpectinata]
IDSTLLEDETIALITSLHNLLETCRFQHFWGELSAKPDLIRGINGFENSIRKFICHVIQITYQTIEKSTLRLLLGGLADNQLNQWM